jgi:hypothetical protein
VTRAGRVVPVAWPRRVVAGPPVTVGGVVERAVVSGAEVAGVSRGAPGGTEIAGGGTVLGGGGGGDGTGTVCGPTARDVVGGAVVVVRRRADGSDESRPHAMTKSGAPMPSATTKPAANHTQARRLTREVCPMWVQEGCQARSFTRSGA